jgi:hypothetical protein
MELRNSQAPSRAQGPGEGDKYKYEKAGFADGGAEEGEKIENKGGGEK